MEPHYGIPRGNGAAPNPAPLGPHRCHVVRRGIEVGTVEDVTWDAVEFTPSTCSSAGIEFGTHDVVHRTNGAAKTSFRTRLRCGEFDVVISVMSSRRRFIKLAILSRRRTRPQTRLRRTVGTGHGMEPSCEVAKFGVSATLLRSRVLRRRQFSYVI